MNGPSASVVLVIVAGPQASGKSTVALALTDALRQAGSSVALVELDRIAEMALPTLPDWAIANAIFRSVTGQWLRSGVSCVIAEGSGTPEEVAGLRARAPDPAAVVTVALTAPLEVALARAQADQTRGVSRERGFLSGVSARWSKEVDRVAADVRIDTGEVSVEGCVIRIRSAMLETSERRIR